MRATAKKAKVGLTEITAIMRRDTKKTIPIIRKSLIPKQIRLCPKMPDPLRRKPKRPRLRKLRLKTGRMPHTNSRNSIRKGSIPKNNMLRNSIPKNSILRINMPLNNSREPMILKRISTTKKATGKKLTAMKRLRQTAKRMMKHLSKTKVPMNTAFRILRRLPANRKLRSRLLPLVVRRRKWICQNGAPMLTKRWQKPFPVLSKPKRKPVMTMMTIGATAMRKPRKNKSSMLLRRTGKHIITKTPKVMKAAIITGRKANKAFTVTLPRITEDIIIRAKTANNITMIRLPTKTPNVPCLRTAIMRMRTAILTIWMKKAIPFITIRTAFRHTWMKKAIPIIWMKTAIPFITIRTASRHMWMKKAIITI